MQGEDDLRGLAKIMAFMRAVSIILVLMHLYWFCYGFFEQRSWTLELINNILLKFNKTSGLFIHTINTKLFIVLFLGLSCLGTRGTKNEKIIWQRISIAASLGFILFFFNEPILELSFENAYFLYILSTGLGYLLLLLAGVWISRILKNNLMNDVFNSENESFQQETKLLYNEYSVNLPTKFYYRGKWNDGWINVVKI